MELDQDHCDNLFSDMNLIQSYGCFFRDYADSGSVYGTPDSGGECGIPYETYFPMPTPEQDKPWYSIEQGSVHFTVISTEHEWSKNSEQARVHYHTIYKSISNVLIGLISSSNLVLLYA